MDYFDLLTFLIMSGVQEKLVAELGDKMVELLERGIENPDRFATLTRLSKAEAMRIVANYNKKIPKATLKAFSEALGIEDEKINKIFQQAFKERRDLSNIADNIANNAAIGMSEILRRQNIALADTQADIWYKVTAEAILRDQSGEARKDVMERAVSELAKNRLKTIDYKSGRWTQIDSAIRRHIITQANQARNRLLMQRMDDWEWDLVFVSAHYGARPDHAEWQGKVYSVSGKSKRYPSLNDKTGYGTVTGLCGANCRHTMTPYIPGYSKLPNTDFTQQEKLTGMTNDQYYFATQKQRGYERSIRQTKREIYELERQGLDTTKQKLILRKQQTRNRVFVKTNHLQRDYSREKLWGVRGPKQYKAGKPVIRQSGGITRKIPSGQFFLDENDKAKYIKAAKYYDSISNGDRKRIINDVANNSGFRRKDIRNVYNHIFIKPHWISRLDGKGLEFRRYHPDIDMAESWERLRTGINIQEHDIILIEHELQEIKYIKLGYSSNEAHALADKKFNYTQALMKRMYDGIG